MAGAQYACNEAAPVLEVSENERKLEYLLRTIEGRLDQDLAVRQPSWTRHDTDLLSQLIQEHQEVGEQGTMRLRTMRTASAYYRVLLDCRANQEINNVVADKLESIRNGIQNIVFDVCEEPSSHTRQVAYKMLLELCSMDVTLIKSNVSALVEVLQYEDHSEHRVACEVLAEHLKLAKEANYPGGSLADCLQLMFDKKQELRNLVLDFFASGPGEKVVDMMAADNLHAAVLARCLVTMLPVAVEADISKTIKILYDLQSIWTGPDDVLADEEASAALKAAVDVLWSLGRVLMDRRNVFVFTASDDNDLLTPGLTKVLDDVDLTPKEKFVQGGPQTFNALVEAVEVMIGRDEATAAQTLSEAKIFVNELEASAQFLFCYLPLHITPQGPKTIEHFNAIQRIVFFRSAANLAARVASATKQSPQELGFPGQKTASDIAEVSVQALKAYIPITDTSSIRKVGSGSSSNDKKQAQEAYIMLATEALLTATRHCLSCMNKPGPLSTDDNLREKVRSLSTLAQEINEKQGSAPQVLKAARMVASLAEELLMLGRQGRSPVEQPPSTADEPSWLMPPPPFPEWKDPSASVLTPTPATQEATSSKNSRARRKRRASKEDTTEERRARGRGAVHYREQSPDHGWDSHVGAEPSTAALALGSTETRIATRGTDTGIAIRGASRAEHRSPADRAEGYLPAVKMEPEHVGPASSLLAERAGERMTSDRGSESSRPRSQDRLKEERGDDASGWGRRRRAHGYGLSRRDRRGR